MIKLFQRISDWWYRRRFIAAACSYAESDPHGYQHAAQRLRLEALKAKLTEGDRAVLLELADKIEEFDVSF